MNKYDDIINLPHYEPKNHPRMSREKRAAQFAPFAAVVGHDEAIEETGRLTEEKIFVDEEYMVLANNRLKYILENEIKQPIEIIYFVSDRFKSGGEYVSIKGQIKKYDQISREIVMMDGTRIPADNVLEINSDVLE